MNEPEILNLCRQAMQNSRAVWPETRLEIKPGQKCAHCGAPTPLGGICPDCGQPICTRSLRVRQLAQETGFNPHWACPVTNPLTPARA